MLRLGCPPSRLVLTYAHDSVVHCTPRRCSIYLFHLDVKDEKSLNLSSYEVMDKVVSCPLTLQEPGWSQCIYVRPSFIVNFLTSTSIFIKNITLCILGVLHVLLCLKDFPPSMYPDPFKSFFFNLNFINQKHKRVKSMKRCSYILAEG